MKFTELQVNSVIAQLKANLSFEEKQALRAKIEKNPLLLENMMDNATERLAVEAKIKAARVSNKRETALRSSVIKATAIAAGFLILFWVIDPVTNPSENHYYIADCCSAYSQDLFTFNQPIWD